MATKAGANTGKSSSRTSAARKRAPAKPVIIDVEADKAGKKPEKSSPTYQPSSASAVSAAPVSAGLDEATARAAGLSASGPAPKPTVGEGAEPSSTAAPTSDGAGGSGTRDNSPGPRAFVLAAAGFVGALAALVLMFLAQLLGLISVPNGQVDVQRTALLGLEERVDARLTSLETVQPVAVQTDLGPLEAELADLRDDLAQLNAQPVVNGASTDFNVLIADALTPLEERIGAIEAVIQFPGPLGDDTLSGDGTLASDDPFATNETPESADDRAPTAAADTQELADLRGLIGSASTAIAALRSDLGSVQADLERVANAENADPAQIIALDERLTQMSTDMADRLAALSVRVAELGDGMAVMGDQLTAFEAVPIAVAPDQLARLGLALDGLATARDSGNGLANALAAAQAASAFDAELSGVLAPLSDLPLDIAVDEPGLLATYESAVNAMRAAAPGSTREDTGLLGALGERARQMVTIRGPGDASNTTPGTVSGQIDQLGSLLASRQYEAASVAFDGLPDAVQTAGSDVGEALNARVSLDIALTQARSGLLAALASSNL